jgi:hypothetical protein
MAVSRLIQCAAGMAASVLLLHCAGDNQPADDDDDAGTSGTASAGKGATSGGAPTTGGTAGSSSAGVPGAGGANAAGRSSTGGNASGGVPGASGSVSAGTANGGTPSAGTSSSGGSTTAGTGSSGAGSSGAGSSAGGAPTAGSGGSSAGGSGAGTGPIVDQGGVGLAKPGDEKTQSREYLNLGDIRVLNNKWGSDELGCNTMMRVFINQDKSIGWDFNRQTCGGNHEKPDYPEIEFGVHPFGAGDPLQTSPPFSSTMLLPKKIGEIQTASVQVEGLQINLQNAASWNINFEFWISRKNPLEPGPEVHAELIVFWGWQNGRWPCDKDGNVSAGTNSYRLCHQDDNWADGRWRYYQFWVDNGPQMNYSGTVDVKALLNWLVSNYGYSADWWVTRFEVGSEIDDGTSGSVNVKNISFEVNGVRKSPVFAE